MADPASGTEGYGGSPSVPLPPGMPAQMHGLPKNSAGMPIPAFVDRSTGMPNPDFRIMDGRFWREAVMRGLCWVCGTKMPRTQQTFVAGPMCLVNHTSAEPPCHRRCAEYSARVCPFLANPNKVRREANLPDNRVEPAGEMILRNPGVSACIVMAHARDWRVFMTDTGPLVTFDQPAEVTWWARGREATRAEVDDSISGGLPLLLERAAEEGEEAERALTAALNDVLTWLPA